MRERKGCLTIVLHWRRIGKEFTRINNCNIYREKETNNYLDMVCIEIVLHSSDAKPEKRNTTHLYISPSKNTIRKSNLNHNKNQKKENKRWQCSQRQQLEK
jgi:hypothetical protein